MGLLDTPHQEVPTLQETTSASKNSWTMDIPTGTDTSHLERKIFQSESLFDGEEPLLQMALIVLKRKKQFGAKQVILPKDLKNKIVNTGILELIDCHPDQSIFLEKVAKTISMYFTMAETIRTGQKINVQIEELTFALQKLKEKEVKQLESKKRRAELHQNAKEFFSGFSSSRIKILIMIALAGIGIAIPLSSLQKKQHPQPATAPTPNTQYWQRPQVSHIPPQSWIEISKIVSPISTSLEIIPGKTPENPHQVIVTLSPHQSNEQFVITQLQHLFKLAEEENFYIAVLGGTPIENKEQKPVPQHNNIFFDAAIPQLVQQYLALQQNKDISLAKFLQMHLQMNNSVLIPINEQLSEEEKKLRAEIIHLSSSNTSPHFLIYNLEELAVSERKKYLQYLAHIFQHIAVQKWHQNILKQRAQQSSAGVIFEIPSKSYPSEFSLQIIRLSATTSRDMIFTEIKPYFHSDIQNSPKALQFFEQEFTNL